MMMKHLVDRGQGHCVSEDFSAVGSTSDLALRLWKADTITGQIMDLCPCHPKHTLAHTPTSHGCVQEKAIKKNDTSTGPKINSETLSERHSQAVLPM